MKPALLIIDVQKDYDKGGALEISNIQKTLPKIKEILEFARQKNFLRIHIQHISLDPTAEDFNPNEKGIEFISGFEPHNTEVKIIKHYPGSFWQTNLHKILQENKIDTLFICGYSSFLCCDTTAREGFQHGYKIYYIEDAIGEFEIGNFTPSEIHQYACAVQKDSGFSEIITVKELKEKLEIRINEKTVK
ncbi:MAG: isochorismatase family protein [Alphaproteobacteria bacterium]|nr:isochorismatase family protein [Alphaproteobacteria bacterium]